MKIRMLVSIAGTDFALSAGDETERFGEAESIRLIAAGSAVPVSDEIETTDALPPNEVRRRNRSRMRG